MLRATHKRMNTNTNTNTNITILHVSCKDRVKVFEKFHVQDIKYYLDKKSLKAITGYMPKYVLVDEEGKLKELQIHYRVLYNEGYTKYWGNDNPIYGNMIFVYPDNIYQRLAQRFKERTLDTFTL